MPNEYRKFDCRICGKQVFAPVIYGLSGEIGADTFIELTCSSGHTDTYEIAEATRPAANSTSDLKTYVAFAGIG